MNWNTGKPGLDFRQNIRINAENQGTKPVNIPTQEGEDNKTILGFRHKSSSVSICNYAPVVTTKLTEGQPQGQWWYFCVQFLKHNLHWICSKRSHRCVLLLLLSLTHIHAYVHVVVDYGYGVNLHLWNSKQLLYIYTKEEWKWENGRSYGFWILSERKKIGLEQVKGKWTVMSIETKLGFLRN